MERAGIKSMHVSISHCRNFAVAYVVAEGDTSTTQGSMRTTS